MSVNPEYMHYNEATVTIGGDYVISNINKKGQPGDYCGCHLQSIEIELPAVGENNAENNGATGRVSIVDYKDAVFKKLSSVLSKYMDGTSDGNAPRPSTYLPTIEISIKCYAGPTLFLKGWIRDWSMSFSGTTPTLDLSWSVICPSGPSENTSPVLKPGRYSPLKIVELVRKDFPKDEIEYDIIINGQSIPLVRLAFNTADGKIDYKPPSKSTGNVYIDVYSFICNNATFNNMPLKGEYNGKKYIMTLKEPESDSRQTEEGEACNGVIFIQNGKYPAYSMYDNQVVIPMTSFKFDTNFNKLALCTNLRQSLNGTTSTNPNKGQETTTGTAAEASNKAAEESSAASNDPITITFECYNANVFSLNNCSAPIKFIAFNEFGNEMIISGKAMVRKCTFSLEGAVLKTSVEATQMFNQLFAKEDDSGGTGEQLSSSESSSSSDSKENASVDNKLYLCTEDVNPVPLSLDKTLEIVDKQPEVFASYVNYFISTYGDLKGTARLVDAMFITNLIAEGCFGFIAILIAVANWGIKGAPSSWKIDAVKYNPEFKSRANFCASPTGKAPFDLAQGGLGIAHWDSGNLEDIYLTVGFDPNMSKSEQDHFANLLVAPKSHTGKIVGWKLGKFSGMDRLFPIFSAKADMCVFDKGLKQDAAWREWARQILYYRDSSGNFPYQVYLFKLWIKKFWKDTINALKSAKPSPGHVICLQDAIRISRCGNSYKAKILPSAGKSVEKQYEIYDGDKPRYVRQKGFCRRAADIIGYEYKQI